MTESQVHTQNKDKLNIYVHVYRKGRENLVNSFDFILTSDAIFILIKKKINVEYIPRSNKNTYTLNHH